MNYIYGTFCVNCQKREEQSFFTCSGCDMVFYCSQACQESNRPSHQKHCVKVEFYFKMLDFQEDDLDSKPELKCRMLINLGKSAALLAKETCSLFTLDIAEEYFERAWKHQNQVLHPKFSLASFPSHNYLSIMDLKMSHLANGNCQSFDAFIEIIKNCPLNSPERNLSGNIFPLQLIKKHVISLEMKAYKQKVQDFGEFRIRFS